MYTLQNLEFTRLQPSEKGIFAFAKYPGWCYEYNFLLEDTGKVKGRTSLGFWQELSSEATSFIQAKIRAHIIEGH